MGTSISPLKSCISLQSSQNELEKPNISCSLKRKRPPKIQIPDVLKEIEVDTHLKFSPFSPIVKEDVVVSCFEDGFVGVSCVKGKKKFMEDTHKIVSCINGDSTKGFFGVYDGHGGRKAAEFVAERLHKNIIEMVDNCFDGTMSKEEVVKAAYLRTDEEFLKQDVGSGSCCVSALIEGDKIVVSNVGDCRAVLCRGGVAEALTKDHRAEREDEQKRIEEQGGYVEFHKGAWRVHGILSVSRSIGDAHLKEWVVSEPDTKILNLTPDMDFLVLASDGLWEEVGNQEAIDIVLQSDVIEKKVNLPVINSDIVKESSLKENDFNFACVSTNSSPKVKRVSLTKPKQSTTLSPSCTKNKNAGTISGVGEFDNENEGPPAKLRRTALFSHKNMRNHSSDQENKRPSSDGLVAACRKLVNLAVTRGSLDDITVMIIDLDHFRQAIS